MNKGLATVLIPVLLSVACEQRTPALAPGGRTADAQGLPAGHPDVTGAETSQELLAKVEAMKAELKGRPKSLEILLALGNLYYENGRTLDAIDWYRQAIEQAQPALAKLDALPKAARTARPGAALRSECRREGRRGSEELSAKGEAHAAKGQLAAAAYCWREALDPALQAQARRGTAFFLAGNPDQGIADHEAVLARDPSFAESLFYLGAIASESGQGDLDRLRKARSAWERFLKVDPKNPRAGQVKENLARVDAAIANGGKSPPQASAKTPAAGRAPSGK